MLKRILLALLMIALSAVEDDVVKRGVAIPVAAKRTSLSAIVTKPKAFNGRTIVTEGIVKSVCVFAGCWMTVATPRGDGAIRVVFSNGATVPRFSSGRQARLLGTVRVRDGKAMFVELRGER